TSRGSTGWLSSCASRPRPQRRSRRPRGSRTRAGRTEPRAAPSADGLPTRVPPLQHADGEEGEPLRWFALGDVDVEPHPAGERFRLQPRAVGLPLVPDHLDRLGYAGIRDGAVEQAGPPEVVGCVEHAVPVAPRVDERADPGAHGLPGRQPAEQVTAQQVLLALAPGLARALVTAARALPREQSLERVERRVERPDRGALDPLAVPAAVVELVLEEPVRDALDVGPEPH